MIRFYDKEVFCIERDRLNRTELRSFFLQGNYAETVCVLEAGRYAGYITWSSLLGSSDIYKSIRKEYIVLDEMVWEKGRQYFAGHETVFGEVVQLPVLNREGELICFAYQDEEADRELRMLRELEEYKDVLTFCDVYPEYAGVTIYGFNEIAYYMEKYLSGLGITVNVEGELWKEFGVRENRIMPAYKNYEIWAEGVWQKSRDLQHERIRSVSSEFECVNKIYETNIKEGRIGDAKGGWDWLLEKLKHERALVIVGTDAESQDAYDLLFKNGIDVCAFLGEEKTAGKRGLFGKPVLEKQEILDQSDDAVFIECHAKYSAWGFGEVDHYDYEGFQRNDRYFLLRDYVEIPEDNLRHVLQKKRILLVGEVNLCNRIWKWQAQCGIWEAEVKYWDILKENEEEIAKLQIPTVKETETEKYDMVMLVAPEYNRNLGLSRNGTEGRRIEYIAELQKQGICDYTDYFSDSFRFAGLQIEEDIEIRKELRPSGIVIGAIPAYSGNILLKQIFDGHPQIIMIEDYIFLNDNLYFICVRLAEKESADILPYFWKWYQEEAKGIWEEDFPDKEKFNRKMEELLELGGHFTSQELFIMFHLAYEAMYGRKISALEDCIIYWEPHRWGRHMLRKWSFWLGGSGLRGFVLSTVRNSYIRAGSRIRASIGEEPTWRSILRLGGMKEKGNRIICEGWEERVVKFEDLKKTPREVLMGFCEWWKISFDEIFMKTTHHGHEAFYKEITGFNLKPVYNPYEEYFTAFDRMRLCLLNSSFQKKYGYPFVNPLDFSRRELQEMFLKEFRWEKIPEAVVGKDETVIGEIQRSVRKRLWQMRFNEIMDMDENFSILEI